MIPSLTDFLQLTPREQADLRFVEQYVRDGKTSEVSAFLEGLPTDLFIRIIENSSVLNTFCQEDSQQQLLLKFLHTFDLTETGFIASCYEPVSLYNTVKGRFYFGLAAEAAKEHGQYTSIHLDYLHKSSQFDCLYAYNDLVAYGVSLQKKTNNKQEHIREILASALRAAEHHWSAGYILLYSAYLTLGNQLNDKEYYIKALESLIIAERLSEHPESKKALYNATFGTSKSPLFPFSNWEHAKNALVSQAKLTPSEIYIAYRQVHKQQPNFLSSSLTEETAFLSQCK